MRPARGAASGLAVSLALVLACAPVASVRAQSDDVPLPPRIGETPAGRGAPAPAPAQSASPDTARDAPAPRGPGVTPRGELLFQIRPQDLLDADAQPLPSTIDTFRRPPNAARLAPLPEERRAPNGVEEIVVLGGNWRLPDLGSRWRARQEEAAATRRVTLLPLYNPDRPTTFNNTFLLNREFERIGFIDIFRVRFGRRSRDDDEDGD